VEDEEEKEKENQNINDQELIFGNENHQIGYFNQACPGLVLSWQCPGKFCPGTVPGQNFFYFSQEKIFRNLTLFF